MNNIQGVDTLLLMHRYYSAEGIIDLPQDLDDLWASSPNVQALPTDEYGLSRGTFHVMVIWEPDE